MTENTFAKTSVHRCPKCGAGENVPGGFRFVAAPGGGLWACECGASWRAPHWVTPAAPAEPTVPESEAWRYLREPDGSPSFASADDECCPHGHALDDICIDCAAEAENDAFLPNLDDDATQTEALNLLVSLQGSDIAQGRMLAAIHNLLYDLWAEPVDVPGVDR